MRIRASVFLLTPMHWPHKSQTGKFPSKKCSKRSPSGTRFSAAAKNLCFMNRPTSPRGGPRTSLAPPTEMTDEKDCKDYVAFPAPLLARPSRMVRGCRLRKLSSFARHAVRRSLCAFSGGVLRRAAQPPLFPPQPLLLKLFSCRCTTQVIQSGSNQAHLSHVTELAT